jgi:hypothetical protein
VEIEPQVLCKACRNDDCSGDAPEVEGYLARLVIDAEVGRDIEWEEGHVAFLLCDQRVGCGARLHPEASLPEPVPVGRVLSLVTWRTAGDAWQPVPERAMEGADGLREVVDRMFDAAGWPGDREHPYPLLRRLDRAVLKVQAAIPGLTEKEEGRTRTAVDWGQARGCEIAAPTSCRPLALRRTSKDTAALELPASDPPEVLRLEVPVTVSVTNDALARRPAGGGDSDRRTDTWTLWSHGFRAEGEDYWSQAVSDLCRNAARGKAEAERDRLKGLPEGDRTRREQIDPRIPARNLRHLVRKMVADDVVSMTELAALVLQVKHLCGFEPRAPDTPGQWQKAR